MHRSVLLNEVVDLLRIRPAGVYVDGTVGSGGHAEAILQRLAPAGRLIGLDRDPAAVDRAGKRLAPFGTQCRLVHGRFGNMADLVKADGVAQVDGIVLDLGVSSDQLESPERGFSFMSDGPLDMRMDPREGQTAADVVNTVPADVLAGYFREYGEEPRAGRIADAIVRARSGRAIRSTADLAVVVEGAVGGRRGRIHPATRVFQALRIVVNDELGEVRRGVEAGLSLLAEKGRMAVIAFHSLEDRVVKTCFRRHAGRWESLPQGGRRWEGDLPEVTWIVRHVVTPSPVEVMDNPRARSARLRVVERSDRFQDGPAV